MGFDQTRQTFFFMKLILSNRLSSKRRENFMQNAFVKIRTINDLVDSVQL